MAKLLWMIFFASLISLLLFSVSLLSALKALKDKNKMSPFECGFDARYASRTSFSLQFFLVSIFFLIFDCELILVFPFILSSSKYLGESSISVFMIFFCVLSASVGVEWSQKKLQWEK